MDTREVILNLFHVFHVNLITEKKIRIGSEIRIFELRMKELILQELTFHFRPKF